MFWVLKVTDLEGTEKCRIKSNHKKKVAFVLRQLLLFSTVYKFDMPICVYIGITVLTAIVVFVDRYSGFPGSSSHKLSSRVLCRTTPVRRSSPSTPSHSGFKVTTTKRKYLSIVKAVLSSHLLSPKF